MNVAVSRRVGLTDCAVVACVVSVSTYPADPVSVALCVRPFGATASGPVGNRRTPHRARRLADRQREDQRAPTRTPSSTSVFARLTARRVAGNVSQTITDAATVIPFALPRLVAPDRDCAVVACFVDVQLYGNDSYEFPLPVSFDPNAPLAPPSALRVLPPRADCGIGSASRCTANDSNPARVSSVRQCISATPPVADASDACAPATVLHVGNLGTLSGRFTVRRVLDLADGRTTVSRSRVT